MSLYIESREKTVLEDVATSFFPGTLNKPASKLAIANSTIFLAAAVGMKLLNNNETAAYALGYSATVGLIGGLSQSKGLVVLSTLSNLGLAFAATVGYGLGFHAFIHR